ncbi:hypothetical protein AB0L13_39040 [Saccharopolyspora shandongensis]|uniref:hypothetical protein n=1 Tax=Saccharopolyspora shandongensis TaxID=418495 RepID=UPI0034405295
MDRIVRENLDSGAVHDVGRLCHGHGTKFLEFAEQIRQAATKTEHTWQGEAGDAMRKHVTQLADHMSHSGSAGERWNTFGPADEQRLARYLDEQFGAFRPAR